MGIDCADDPVVGMGHIRAIVVTGEGENSMVRTLEDEGPGEGTRDRGPDGYGLGSQGSGRLAIHVTFPREANNACIGSYEAISVINYYLKETAAHRPINR